MATRAKPLRSLHTALVTLAAAAFMMAASQFSGIAGGVPAHAAKGAATSPPRCPHRNRATGTARLSAYFRTMTTQTFNPYQQGNSPRFSPPGLFEGYFVYDNKLKLLPQMARAVPTLKNGQIRDRGRTIVVRLKAGLRWSNGVEITAKDAKFGWRVDTDRATGPKCTGSCDQIAAIDTPDRYTIIFHLKRVTPQLIPDGLPHIWPHSWPGAWNNDPQVAAVKLGQDPTFSFKGPTYPTDGPYQVARVVEGKQIVLKPMRYYSTMTCGAFISTITATLYPSVASQIAAAASGQLDQWEGTSLALDVLPEIRLHGQAYHVHLDPSLSLERLEFNVDPTYDGKPNPLHELKVRQALALAVDKVRLTQAGLAGLTKREVRSIVAWTPWLNTPRLARPFADRSIVGQWDPLVRTYLPTTGQGRALRDARTLLASTQWKHGFSMAVLAATLLRHRTEVAEFVAAWAPLGVTVHAVFVDPFRIFASWNDGGPAAHGQFQGLLDAYPLVGTDSDVLRQNLESSNIDRRHTDHPLLRNNFSGINDPAIDRAFQAGGRTFNRTLRSTNYAVIQREMNSHAYWIPLYFPPGVWTDNGHILQASSTPADVVSALYWNVWAWKPKGR